MSPKQGMFENDQTFHDRVAKEDEKANSQTINDSGGDGSKKWHEDTEKYRDRIENEANRVTVEDSGGDSSQRFFEGEDTYDVRIRREANEQRIENAGSRSGQGFFEGDHDYRSRIADEARDLRGHARSKDSKNSYPKSNTYSDSDSSSNYYTKPSRHLHNQISFKAIFIFLALGLGISVLSPLLKQRSLEIAKQNYFEETQKQLKVDNRKAAQKLFLQAENALIESDFKRANQYLSAAKKTGQYHTGGFGIQSKIKRVREYTEYRPFSTEKFVAPINRWSPLYPMEGKENRYFQIRSNGKLMIETVTTCSRLGVVDRRAVSEKRKHSFMNLGFNSLDFTCGSIDLHYKNEIRFKSLEDCAIKVEMHLTPILDFNVQDPLNGIAKVRLRNPLSGRFASGAVFIDPKKCD